MLRWRYQVVLLALVAGLVAGSSSVLWGEPAPDRWPELHGGGAAAEIVPGSLPLTWSSSENVAWKTELTGAGQSSPVIWGMRLFVTSISGSMKEHTHLTAIDLDSGEVLWRADESASQPVRANYFQARAAPTPTVDARAVYVFFETGDLMAYRHDGTRIWHRSIAEDYGPFESNIGLAASTVLTDDAVIILVDHEGPSYLAAFDKATGNELWRTERDPRGSYASPALVPVGEGHHVAVSSSGSVDGYDPETGAHLWSFDQVGGNRAAKPIVYGDGRFLVAGSGGMHDEHLEMAQQSNLSMSVAPTVTGFAPRVHWRAEKAIPDFASPIVHQGCAYWVTRVGILYCFDPETGERKYAERLKGGRSWATPIGVGDRVYVFGKQGTTFVVAAGPRFEVLAKNALWDAPAPAESSGRPARSRRATGDGERPVRGRDGRLFDDPTQYAALAVSGSLFIRTGSAVYCLRESAVTP